MPKYFYTAVDVRGKKMTGIEQGNNKEEVINLLQSRGHIVLDVADAREGAQFEGASRAVKTAYTRMHYRISFNDIVLFARQLATLLGAGITLLKAMQILARQVSSQRLSTVLNKIIKDMEAGLSLHEAMAKHPRVFSEMWVNLVESGEASGSLPLVLGKLAAYLEKQAEFRRKVISALVYPIILLTVAVGGLTVFLVFIIPTFEKLYKGFNIDLPLATQLLINLSVYLRKWIIFFVIAIAAGIWLLRRYIATENGRRQWEKFKFSLPLFGEFFRISTIETFASEMSTLIESGVPILYALEITERSVNNRTMSDIVRQIKEDVRAGKTLSAPMEHSGFFAPMVVQMVTIGEEIGDLPNMFKKVCAYYQEYIEMFISRLAATFEPLMIVFMGLVIGTMVICMYLPIFKIAALGTAGG